jgi:phasin family protein
MTQPRNHLLDFYRASLKVTSDATRAYLEGAVRLRTKQLQSIDEALTTHTEVVTELDAAKDLDELVAVSRKLAEAQYQTLVSYWSGIFEAMGDNQAEVMRLVQSQLEQIRSEFEDKLGGAPDVPVPILAALQPLMEVASSAYALTARATAEATKLAAAQLDNPSMAARRNAKRAQQQSA